MTMANGMGNAENLDWAGFYPSDSSSSMEPGHKVWALVDIVCTCRHDGPRRNQLEVQGLAVRSAKVGTGNLKLLYSPDNNRGSTKLTTTKPWFIA